MNMYTFRENGTELFRIAATRDFQLNNNLKKEFIAKNIEKVRTLREVESNKIANYKNSGSPIQKANRGRVF